MLLDLKNPYYIDTHKKFIDYGWNSFESSSKVLFTYPGIFFNEFSIKIEKNKTIVSIPILESDIQYYTQVSDINEACHFLQTHLEYYTKKQIKRFEK